MTEQQAIRMALEALEIAADGGGVNFYEYAKDLRQFLEQQPADKPVAWMFQHEETGRMNYVSNDGMNSPEFFMRMNQRYTLVCALYTRPQPAAWVGLTDEELKPLCDVNHIIFGAYTIDFVRAIEAKLKEKNT